jgi:hypothetical protein
MCLGKKSLQYVALQSISQEHGTLVAMKNELKINDSHSCFTDTLPRQEVELGLEVKGLENPQNIWWQLYI